MPKKHSKKSKKGGRKGIVTKTSMVSGQLPIRDAQPMPAPRDPICTIRRTYTLATLSANTGDTANGFSFALNSLPNYGEFTALFDQYRILEAIVSFIPLQNMSVATSGTTNYPGIFMTAIDYDDANLPATSDLQQYESYQRIAAYRPCVRVVKPRSAVALYNGSTFTGYGTAKHGQWIDAASPSIPHYGLKTIIHGAGYAASTNVYEVEVQLVCQFKSIH